MQVSCYPWIALIYAGFMTCCLFAAVREKGYWVQLLQKGGLLDVGNERPRVRRDLSDQMRSHGSPFRSGYLVNRLLSQISDWQTVFTVLRDLEPLFDHINVSTAMHRLAKVSVRNKVTVLSLPAASYICWLELQTSTNS